MKFTFVELIAVLLCTILGTMLLLPCLAHSALDRKTIVCIDNLKRIADAALSYADDNHDYSITYYNGKRSGWSFILSEYAPPLARENAFHCPDDLAKRNNNASPLSYSLNTGHLWNKNHSSNNKREWGPLSAGNGFSLRLSSVPDPADTSWFYENRWRGNNVKDLIRTAFSTYTVEGYHQGGMVNNMMFMDGHVETIRKSDWLPGNLRGVVFKDLHAGPCTPDIP